MGDDPVEALRARLTARYEQAVAVAEQAAASRSTTLSAAAEGRVAALADVLDDLNTVGIRA